MNKTAAVVDDFMEERHHSRIEEAAGKAGFTVRWFSSDAEAKGKLEGCEVLYGHSTPELIRSAPDLRWFCCAYAGVEPYVAEGAIPKDCLLTNSSGAYGVTIAEHIMMVTLMLLRRMPEYQARMAKKDWTGGLPVRSIKGSTVTILGTGDIGTTFAKRVRAMEPKAIFGVNRSGRRPDGVYDEVYPLTKLENVLPQTDILVMAIPNTKDTVGLLSRERIALLPETAYFVNVGRGKTVDQDALVEALNAGKLAGAALDVMVPEPLNPDNPLWDAKNSILTAHVSGNMTLGYTCDRDVEMFCEDLLNYAAGHPLAHLVDRKLGY